MDGEEEKAGWGVTKIEERERYNHYPRTMTKMLSTCVLVLDQLSAVTESAAIVFIGVAN